MRAGRKLKNPDLSRGWRSWLEMVEERRRLRNAAARLRHPGMSHALGEWRRVVEEEAKRLLEAKRRDAEARFAELKRHCEEVQRELMERDAQSALVRRRLDDALAAGRQAIETEV